MPTWDFSFYLFGFSSKGFSVTALAVLELPHTNSFFQSPTIEDKEQHDKSNSWFQISTWIVFPFKQCST